MYQSVENQVAKECLINQLTSAVDGTHSSRKRRVMFLVWSLAAFKLHQTYVCHGFQYVYFVEERNSALHYLILIRKLIKLGVHLIS